MLRGVSILAVFVALAAGSPALGDGPDRVYTNADLERLEPLPSQSAPIVSSEELGWEFVTDFIEREHKRLESERAHDLERTLVDAEARALERRRPGYGLALAPYTGFFGHQGRNRVRPPGKRRGLPDHHETSFRLHFPTGGRITPLHARPGGRITPLHARPSGPSTPSPRRPRRSNR